MAELLWHRAPVKESAPAPGQVHLWEAAERQMVNWTSGELTFSRRMQRAVLANYLGIPAAQVRIHRRCPRCGAPHGRPTVPGAGIDFSVAHSAGTVLIAVVGGARVGVDIEQPTDSLSRHFVAKALGPEEAAVLTALPIAARSREIARRWCRAEALAKLSGLGVLGAATPNPVVKEPARSIVDLDLDRGLVGAIASSGPIDHIWHRRARITEPREMSQNDTAH